MKNNAEKFTEMARDVYAKSCRRQPSEPDFAMIHPLTVQMLRITPAESMAYTRGVDLVERLFGAIVISTERVKENEVIFTRA